MGYPCPMVGTWSRPPAPPSITPPARTQIPPTGTPGAQGAITLSTATYDQFAENVSSSYLNIILSDAIDQYVNLNFPATSERLVFINSIVSKRLSQVGSPVAEPDAQSFQAIATKTGALARQLQLGLDYYGQPLNHVPRLSLEDYLDQAKALISSGNDIEQAYLQYQTIEAAHQAGQAAFVDARQKAKVAVDVATQNVSNLVAQQNETADSITRLNSALTDLWFQLNAADQAFQNAVANIPGGGCQFTQVLAIGAALATLFVSGGATAAALPAALSSVAQSSSTQTNPDSFANFNFKVNTVVTIGKDASSFFDAFNKFKASLNPLPSTSGQPPNLPSDSTKLVSTADQIESSLQPYISADIPEAKAYDALIKAFVATAEAKNNKVLEYNVFDAQIATAKSNVQQQQALADAAQNSLALSQNPFFGDAVTYMKAAWIESLAAITRAIYQMKAAYKYYALDDPAVEITDFSTASLTSALQAITDAYKNKMEKYGADPESIKELKIEIFQYISDKTIQYFRETGSVTVIIPPDDAEPRLYTLYSVYITRVWLVLEDENGKQNSFRAKIRHEGRALLFDVDRTPHIFSHIPVPIEYIIEDGSETVDGTVIQEQSEYAGLTPYGPWTIEIDKTSLPQDFLTKVSKVSIMFNGKGRPYN